MEEPKLLSYIEFFDLFSEKYDLVYEELFKERTQKELNFISHFIASGRIIDLACGTGRHAIELANKNEYEVIGVDASWGMLEKARKKTQQRKVKVDFVLGDLRAVPLASNIASGVICIFSAICHLLEESWRKSAVAEMHRLLIPGGVAIVDVVDWHWLIGRYNYFHDKKRSFNLRVLCDTIHTENKYFSPPISTRLHHYTEEELEELFCPLFSKVELYSNFEVNTKFKEGDERIVLVAKK